MPASSTTVVVFVPGTTASELIFQVLGYGTQTVWPNIVDPNNGKLKDIAYAQAMQKTTATIGNIVSTLPLDPPAPVYADLIAYFTNGANFSDGVPFTYFSASTANLAAKPSGNPPAKLFFTAPYDWRQDNTSSAAYLGQVLGYLDTMYGAGWSYQASLLAHSNGGLVSRCLLETTAAAIARNTNATPSWWNKVKMLITLATPHLGAPLAWSAIAGLPLAAGETGVEISFVQSVVDSNSFPSTFELLPPESLPFIADAGGGFQDIYAATSGSQLYRSMTTCGVDIANLATAAAFFGRLQSLSASAPPPKTYQFFYGTGLDTLACIGQQASADAAFLYNPVGSTAAEIFIPQIQSGAGDKVVPASSASYGFTTAVPTTAFPGYSHGDMGGCNITGSGTSLGGNYKSILAAATALGLNPVQPAG